MTDSSLWGALLVSALLVAVLLGVVEAWLRRR